TLAVQQQRTNTRRIRVQQGNLSTHGMNTGTETEWLQQRIGPCTGGDEVTPRRETALVCLHALDTAAIAHESAGGTIGTKLNPMSGAGCLERLQMPRIAQLCHARQIIGAINVRREIRLPTMQLIAGQFLESNPFAAPFVGRFVVVAQKQFESAADEIAVVDAGLLAQGLRETWIHGRTASVKLLVGRVGIGGIGGRNDARAGPGCLLTEVALVHNGHTRAGLRQEVRRGQTDDAAAEHEYVGMLYHKDCYSRRGSIFESVSTILDAWIWQSVRCKPSAVLECRYASGTRDSS